MDNRPINDPTPRGRTNPAIRVIGTLVIAALILSIILLALGVVHFEPSGWF